MARAENTVIERGTSQSSERAGRERRFYTRMAWLILFTIVLGFAPSFYFRFLGFSYPRPNPVLVPNLMVHGLVFSAWVGVFVAQVSLVGAGRRDLHRKLGILGFLLGVAMVPLMYLLAVWQVARASQPPFTDPLTWTVVPLIGIPFFVVLLGLAWRERRRDLQAHKRLLLGIMIILTQPATGRLPLLPPTLVGHVVLALFSLLLFIPLVLWDRRTLGRLHWATKLGAASFVAIIALQTLFMAVPGVWASLAAHLPGIGLPGIGG